MPIFSLPSDLLERIRLLFAAVAVTATAVLLPIVVLGDREDEGLARALAVAGLVLTAWMQVRTYRQGTSDRWRTTIAIAGLFIAATGVEHPRLVMLTLVTNLCFHALYASFRGTVVMTGAYLALYSMVVMFAAVVHSVPIDLLDVSMAMLSLCMAAGSWRFVFDALTKVKNREAHFRSLVQHASEAVTVLKSDGAILYDSGAIQVMLGYSTTERLGWNALDDIHPDDLPAALITLDTVIEQAGVARRVELRYRHADGSWRWLEVTATSRLHDPAVKGVVVNYRDISEERTLNQALRHQALHDPLTGLANRHLFFQNLDQAIRRSLGEPGRPAVFFCDLDDFKTINDGMSHAVGDTVLTTLAARLTAATRGSDTTARLGGDEFAVLVPDVEGDEQAEEIGQRLLTAITTPIDVDGLFLNVAASIGVAIASPDASADEVLAAADLAMHKAKRQGKARVQAYDDLLRRDLVERLALRADLERAIDADELEPFYQPIVDLDSGRFVGVEALVRWRHPERGLLAPGAFIGLAEETGLIVPIGSAVLRRACGDLATWRDTTGDDDLYVSVNVSPVQLHRDEFVDEVLEVLAATGLPTGQLLLEVTETMLLEDTATTITALTRLRDLGVSVALDDFGTGYSSLTHLRRYPVAVIKVDRSFVMPMLEGREDRAVVQAVLDLAGALGLRVVAEGVETAEHADTLAAMGCAWGQGYHFAKPLPREALFDLLAARRPSMEAVI